MSAKLKHGLAGIGANCKVKTYKSPSAAKGAASAFRSMGKKVTVKGKRIAVCPS